MEKHIKYLAFIFISIIGLSSMDINNPLDVLRNTYKIDATNIPYTQTQGVKDIEALREMGAMLFDDSRLGAFGNTSCQSSCHVKGNNLAPSEKTQVGLGSFVDFDGKTYLSKYLPKNWVIDAPKINSPQSENLVFRKKVLHNGATTPMGQASEMFGLFAHNLDWTNLIHDETYQNYAKIVWGDTRITERRISKALVTFQESCVSQNNDFQDWANGRDMSHRFYNFLETLDNKCLNCHSGKDLGGSGLTKGQAVYKEGTDVSFLKTENVLTRSLYNSDAFDNYGWVGDYSTLNGFLTKHATNENIELTTSEKKRLIRGLKKYLND